MSPPSQVRLQKILAAAGVASRRRCEDLLRAGRVSVNGRVARVGESADPQLDRVAVDGEVVRPETPAYWVLHKPRGPVTTVHDPFGRRTVMHLVPERAGRLFPVGRLDCESEGLVLLTNDGALAHELLHPSRGCEREYRVTVRGCPSPASLRRLARGVVLEDGRTARARVGRPVYDPRSDTSRLALTLTEGRKRQIRRALAALGHPVRRLLRVRMGPLRLGRLAPGEARPLRRDEREALGLVQGGAQARARPRKKGRRGPRPGAVSI